MTPGFSSSAAHANADSAPAHRRESVSSSGSEPGRVGSRSRRGAPQLPRLSLGKGISFSPAANSHLTTIVDEESREGEKGKNTAPSTRDRNMPDIFKSAEADEPSSEGVLAIRPAGPPTGSGRKKSMGRRARHKRPEGITLPATTSDSAFSSGPPYTPTDTTSTSDTPTDTTSTSDTSTSDTPTATPTATPTDTSAGGSGIAGGSSSLGGWRRKHQRSTSALFSLDAPAPSPLSSSRPIPPPLLPPLLPPGRPTAFPPLLELLGMSKEDLLKEAWLSGARTRLDSC